MKIFFSAQDSTFVVGGPSGAHTKQVSHGVFREMLAAREVGKMVIAGPDGGPVAVDAPSPTRDEIERGMREGIKAERYRHEIAGISLTGMAIDTGRDSQALITGAALAAVLDPEYSCQWKTPAGFVQLSSEQIIAVASAVRSHVQSCFDREAELLAEIDAGTYSEEMLAVGWPA